VVIALSVSQGLDGVLATGVGEDAADVAGAAAMATVETEQREIATAVAVRLRMKADINPTPIDGWDN
jgi:hypothetical protein